MAGGNGEGEGKTRSCHRNGKGREAFTANCVVLNLTVNIVSGGVTFGAPYDEGCE